MKKLLMLCIASTIAFNLFCQVGNKKKDTIDLRKNIPVDAVTLWNFPLYTIIPSNVIHGGKGRLTAYLPKDTTITINTINGKINYHIPIYSIITTPNSMGHYDTINVPVDLAPSFYHVRLNKVEVDIPVEKGKITRLKAGFLIITSVKKEISGAIDEWEWTEGVLFEPTEETWEWTLRKPGTSDFKITGKKGKIFALPPGEYSLSKSAPNNHVGYKFYKVIIKDGEWVVNGVKTN